MFSAANSCRFRAMIRFVVLLMAAFSIGAAENPPINKKPPSYADAIVDFKQASEKGLLGNALAALDRAIELDPKRFDAYFYRGGIFAIQNKSEQAIADFSKVIEIDPKASTAYDKRGWEEFKLNKIDRALEDFDRYLALEPQQAPYQWQRGIVLYYAGKYDEGRKQFELHQTVNPHDVENAVWHFMCITRDKGFEKARASLIPITGDFRVPMAEIHELFRGTKSPDDVLKATNKANPSDLELEGRNFYAHLYLGLYFEAKGEKEQAYEHIK